MDIQDLHIFVRVSSVQNLSAVATELALTPGTISKRIQSLEDELGVRLFDRTTRSIRITAEGLTFLAHANRILEELERAQASVGDNTAKPKGKLKITAPSCIANNYIVPALCRFISSYPNIDVQIDLSDRLANLQEEGYDVAIRMGVLPDSTLIAKRLANDREVIAASPAYLRAHGTPLNPSELAEHHCLIFGDQWSWTLSEQKLPVAVRINGRVRSNDAELLRRAALEGFGLLRTSELRVQSDLAEGRLVRVLPHCPLIGDAAIWAVYPGTRHVLPKLRVLLDFLADWFRAAVSEPAVIPRTVSAEP